MGSIADGLKHLALAAVLCFEQAAAGRKFALEHSAKDVLKVLMRQSGASRVNLGQCTMGLTSRDSLGAPPARELTSVATNSDGIALELQKFQCDGTHGHVPTDSERVKQRQIYPEALCEAICVTTAKERPAAKPGKEIFGLASKQQMRDPMMLRCTMTLIFLMSVAIS